MHNFKMLVDEALNSASGWQRITSFEFNVVPVLNPDGYSYSWTNVRLWRKNRRNNGQNYGVDLNRNYPIGWGGTGSSGSTGSSTYRGPAPFSEPELSGLRAYLDGVATRVGIVYSLDYHSYGQYVIHPLGYTETQAPDHAALNSIAQVYGAAVEATGGLNYIVGQSSVAQYPAGGTSEDFYYDEYGALGGTIELRPTGNPGFELPPSQILPTISEHWAGFRAAVNALN
jgi:carboxypeptidase A2